MVVWGISFFSLPEGAEFLLQRSLTGSAALRSCRSPGEILRLSRARAGAQCLRQVLLVGPAPVAAGEGPRRGAPAPSPGRLPRSRP